LHLLLDGRFFHAELFDTAVQPADVLVEKYGNLYAGDGIGQ
jgi:hypothetical protein